jgi:deazaflavin-dependent oxidoreductase (nitroreductase family)
MPEKIAELTAPSGLLLLFFHLPRWIYRLKLGWILGGRFLLLTHRGRKTGQPHQTVLEVAGYDPSKNTYFVVAAYGNKADWYRNLLKTPRAEIAVRNRSWAVRAEPLKDQDSGQVILDYAHNHPVLIKELSHFMGYRVDGSDEDYRLLGALVPVIALRPVVGEDE